LTSVTCGTIFATGGFGSDAVSAAVNTITDPNTNPTT